MAKRVTLGGDGKLIIGTDTDVEVEVLDEDELPVDIGGFTMTFDVRRRAADAGSLFSASASVTGVYNAVRSANTQRALVEMSASDLDYSIFQPGTYQYSLIRTNAGAKVPIVYGDFEVELITQK
jgi:hypothetical protein